MARIKTIASIDAKIRKAQESVEKTKTRYNAAVTELETLHDEKKALQIQELAAAMEKSEKSYEEVLKFVKDGNP